MIRRPPRSTQSRSSAASDVYKRQASWQSITRISCRPRLFSRVMAWVCGVGGGGKTLFGEQRRERVKEALLVLFDRQQVIAALLIKNLLYRRHLSMRRIGQHDLTDDIQLS